MSRRKQAKPQHLKSDEETLQTDVASENALSEGTVEEEESDSRGGSGEETHVCEKCCAEFFHFAELCEHQRGCTETEDPPVLIVKEDEGGIPLMEDVMSPAGLSPAPSMAPSLAPSDSADVEFTEAVVCDLGVETATDNDSADILGEINTAERGVEPMDVEERSQQDLHHHHHHQQQQQTASPQSAEPPPSQMSSTVTSYSTPSSTNVTLEILHNTRVAVAQFSQVIHSGGGGGGKAATAAIPVILEHLLALQQQQVHQLQLIEQIRSQVAVMNRQPTQTALNPASRALSLGPNPFQPQGLIAPPVLPLSGTMPSAVNGHAASVSLASMLERSQTLSSSQSECGQTDKRDVRCTSTSSFDYRSPPPPSNYSSISTILHPYTGNTHNMSVSCTQTPLRSTCSPVRLSLGQSGTIFSPSSSSLPFLPHSPPSSGSGSSSSTVIFPNPLASIAATADALDPLAALIKQHQKGKLPNVSMFDTKPGPEEPFFKHKCRFCAKVFGSDSALQIHLRSHTGERPFKCNICGNRFSTKGNLKVHFQRHKEKYPHLQMNPYPVPEYLDNVPTSSGIPYGMSFPPEKPGATWLDSKPVLATLPTPMGLQLPSTLTGMGSSICDSLSVTPSNKSPYRPSPASSECLSLSPDTMSNEPTLPNASEPLQSHRERGVSHVLKAEIHLPQNCIARPRATPPATIANSAALTTASVTTTATTTSTTATTPDPSAPTSPISNPVTSPHLVASSTDQFKVDFPFDGLLQTSETTKLQQLVENIDKKITDPNQCLLCHRVLSCQSALKMHYRIHTGERPFKCRVCGRAFTTKGNLKTHISVHRANPPLRVQHSCPICQKKFTNAVVLQQHIHMHMGGQIPDSPLLTDGCTLRDDAMDADLPFDEGNYDSLSNYENDLTCDDNSMGEEEEGEEDDGDEEEVEVEEEETENMEGGDFDPFKPLISSPCSPPRSSAVVSSIAALENQMRMIDSTVSLNHSFGLKFIMNGFMDRERCSALGSSSSTVIDVEMENHKAVSPAVSESSTSASVPVPASPARSLPEGHHHHNHHHHHHHRSPSTNHRTQESQEMTASVKRERSDSPNPTTTLETQELRGILSTRPCVKEESPYSMLFLSRERGGSQHMPNMAASSAQGTIKTEVNGHHNRPVLLNERPHSLPFSLQMPAAPPPLGGPGLTSLLGPPLPRRTPKQHNCHSCGKNFSSASALQIHERTHTGEKPFGCSICGRAFTTKGNLKVHMGTHMWNNTPARRGRRLSIENPMALLGGDAVKFGEMFQKDLAARAMNVDPGFWNRYAAAITNGLAMKNNEISVIQNGGLPQIHAMSTGRDRGVNPGGSPPMTSLGKTGMELGVNFSMLIDDSKEIGIN